jgi:hypothetical protein
MTMSTLRRCLSDVAQVDRKRGEALLRRRGSRVMAIAQAAARPVILLMP